MINNFYLFVYFFFEVVDQNCHITYTYDAVQELKLLLLHVVVPNMEISDIKARLKTKIRRKQKKIFQN